MQVCVESKGGTTVSKIRQTFEVDDLLALRLAGGERFFEFLAGVGHVNAAPRQLLHEQLVLRVGLLDAHLPLLRLHLRRRRLVELGLRRGPGGGWGSQKVAS